MDEVMKIMEKDIVLEKCVCAIANLSRKKQTPNVCMAEGALAYMRRDILNRDENDIDFDYILEQIHMYEAVE